MTTENTELDFEWMKRGGVFLAQDNQLPQHIAFFGMTCGIVVKRLINSQSAYSVGDWSIFASSYTPARMATREECTAAGIEYIERPVSTEELKSLREDKEMLEFLIKTPALWVEETEDGFEANVAFNNGAYRTFGEGKTPRDAILDAMKGGV